MKCIICGKEKEPSKEHIIPEALGNNKFCTQNVCADCNNRMGANIDSYITEHPLIKFIRKSQNITGKKISL